MHRLYNLLAATSENVKRFISFSGMKGMDVFLPPLCMACESMVSEAHGFCGSCWQEFSFIVQPQCSCCGLPFEYAAQGLSDAPHDNSGVMCGDCLLDRPNFSKARAALVYNENSKAVLLPFKHRDRTDFALSMARLMRGAGGAMFEDYDVFMPVPLHAMRLFTRRYNQSALLAKELSRMTDVPVALHALIRNRSTVSQGTLSREERMKNVKNAFSIRKKYVSGCADKKILLIDDVYTTGATAKACVQALLNIGAKEVGVLTFARVVKTG